MSFYIVHPQFWFYVLSHIRKLLTRNLLCFYSLFYYKDFGGQSADAVNNEQLNLLCRLKEFENKGDIKRCNEPSDQNLLVFHTLKDWILYKAARPFLVACRRII